MSGSTDRKSVEAALREFLREECYLGDDPVAVDAPLFSSGLLSSLDLIDLIAFMEKEFALSIDSAEVKVEKLDTVTRIADFVLEKRSP